MELFDRIAGIEWNAVEFDRNDFVAETSSKELKNVLSGSENIIMWGICCVCTLVLTVAKGRGALEEMGTYPRHVLYFLRQFCLRQFGFYPNVK